MSSHTRQSGVVVSSLTVLLLGLAPAIGWGQAAQPPPPIGTRVVIKAGAVLKRGTEVVDTGKAHHIYTIERVNGPWLWLISGTVSGWAQAAEVVRFDQAIELYTSEIKRDPRAAWAYYNRGVIRADQQAYDQAIADYDEAIRLDPKFILALINRGNAWLARKEYDKAIADYSQAIELEPKHILAHLNRGIASQAKKKYDSAIADYDEAIKLGLKTAAAYNNRGHLLELQGNLDQAISDYSEAIRINPRYSLAFFNRGNARQTKGEFEKSIADYEEAIRLDPRSPWGYSGLAWILATCPDAKYRDGKKAVERAVHACDLGGTNNSYLEEVRAAAHAEAGEFDQAVEWQSKALKAAESLPGSNLVGDRSRLQLYQDKKPFRNERVKPSGS